MMNYRSLAAGAVAAIAIVANAATARADGLGCTGPNCGGSPGCYGNNGKYCNLLPYPTNYSLSGGGKKQLPTYQAAPWYLYWPYDGHFLTPAPVTGAFYGPPSPGNFPVNPYFPGPSYGYGYGPMPGGPAPIPMMAPPGGYPAPGAGFGPAGPGALVPPPTTTIPK
jgi:hypothetical protein